MNRVDPKGTIYTYNPVSKKVAGRFEKPYYSAGTWGLYTKNANCYAYALNMIVSTKNGVHSGKLQPGEISGKIFWNYNSDDIIVCLLSALTADLKKIGLKCVVYKSLKNKTQSQINKEKNGYYVALVVTHKSKKVALNRLYKSLAWDYHWYRLDYNTFGRWSHKRGLTKVTNVDAKNRYINNVATANRNYGGGYNYSSSPVYILIYK